MARALPLTVTFNDEQMASLEAKVDALVERHGELWQQIRDLHKPDPVTDSDTVWCGECAWPYEPDASWPCPTARLVYNDDEITAQGEITP